MLVRSAGPACAGGRAQEGPGSAAARPTSTASREFELPEDELVVCGVWGVLSRRQGPSC